jgi:hypothetical protein
LPQLQTQQKRANDQQRQREKVKIPYGMSMAVCNCCSTVYLTSLRDDLKAYKNGRTYQQIKIQGCLNETPLGIGLGEGIDTIKNSPCGQ